MTGAIRGRRPARLAWICLAISGIGCGGPTVDEPAAEAGDAVVLARYAGGVVTADDLRQRILGLPSGARRPADGDFQTWYRMHIRELTLERLAHADARAAGVVDQPAFQQRSQQVRRQVISGLYAETHLPPVAPVTEAEMRARYAGEPEHYRIRPRREVYQLFKRIEPESDRAAVRAEIDGLRARVFAGERFQALAARHSDSETRHGGGALGWFEPGQLAPALDTVVFALLEREPSEPIATAEGFHLFWIENAFSAQQLTFDEAKTSITNRMQWERRQVALDTLAGVPPDGSFVPDREELATLMAGRDPRALILRLGSFSLNAGTFAVMVGEARRDGSSRAIADLPWRLLGSIRQRELLYRQAEAAGFEAPEGYGKVLERLEARALVQVYLQGELASRVRRDEAALRAYHALHQRRFSEPLRLRLTWLTVPLSSRANQNMIRLETARADLDAGKRTLAAEAEALGGQIEAADWQTLDQIRGRAATAAKLAVELDVGAHSAPFRYRDALHVLRVEARREPVLRTFEAAVGPVVADYLEHHGTEVLAAYREGLLADGGFESFSERLAAFSAEASSGIADSGTPAVTP